MGDYRELMIEDVQQMVEESINPELIGFVNEKIIDAARNGNTTVEGRIRLLDYKFDVNSQYQNNLYKIEIFKFDLIFILYNAKLKGAIDYEERIYLYYNCYINHIINSNLFRN